jgi:serine/threonine-protein kinase
MDSKIFLHKYRVAAEEIAAAGEPGASPRAYEAEEIDSGKTVVVEVVPAGSLTTPAREKLVAEAMAARKVTHANIPALHDFGVEDDLLVYVTEICEGTLAEEWVNANGPMPVGPVLRIASQVVSALGAAAFHRIAHRAINPGNLVLVPGQTAEGEWPLVQILHFVGIVPKFSETDAAAVVPDKALPYASPEQVRGGAVDFRSEIYSLGGTMWFLLTGTPPPMAAQMTTAWLAVDQMSVMPKKIGRLLAKMLSIDPAERPGDPLAFYRQLQDCLTEVARRGTTPSPSAVPVARTIAIDPPKKRRSLLKTRARAALVLAMAALTALGLHEYVRHLRVVQAEEPIGVPVGVSETSASATPVNATKADTMVSIVTQPTPVIAAANTTQSLPTESAASDIDTAPAQPTPVIAAANTTQSLPTKSAVSDIDTAPAQPTPVAASNLSTLLATIDSSPVASTSQAETRSAESPNAQTSAEDQPTAPKKTIMHEVRRALPADEEETPAEPSPPGDGPPKVAPEMSSVAKTEPSRDVKAEVAEKPPAMKTEPPAKPKRRTDEKIYLLPGHEFEAPTERLPRGSVRGRFMGVTANGKWMFELPSHEIVIVPPPSNP